MKKLLRIIPIFLTVILISGTPEKDFSLEKSNNNLIQNLMAQMSLDEKIGQMTMMCISSISANGDKTLFIHPDSALKAIVKYNVGSFISGFGTMAEWKDFVTKLQKMAVTQSRHKIPLLIGIDHVHGANYIKEGTILPHNLNLSCSFDTSLVRKCAALTADETLEAGIRWNLAPVLDLGKNAYWPRLYETFGEDPFVCAAFGAAYVSGIQTDSKGMPSGIAACGKHFIGYSDPKSGWDRTLAEIPDQLMYELFVPPFREAINRGISSIMLNSGEVNGVPVHASLELVNDLLKGYLNFKGIVVSDIKDIQKIVSMHRFAVDEKEATLLAINAGLDISMACNSYDFIRYIKELVQEGKISEQRINMSVEKILRFKSSLGLFNDPYPAKNTNWNTETENHRTIALLAAENSIVLLKNDGILPLNNKANIAVTGIAANSKLHLTGGWTFDWNGAPEERQPKDMVTILDALKQEFKQANIYEVSSSQGEHESVKLLNEADVIILTAGEKPYSEFQGNINDLALDEAQDKWIKKVLSLGKPVILTLIEGRPRLITSYAEKASAVVFAGLPGMKGAEALSGILSGRVNPSGHLSFSYPLAAGHVAPYYQKFSDTPTVLYPFGYGLSYTQFGSSEIQLSDSIFRSSTDTINANIKISNIGSREGKDAVLWYISYPNGKITRPQKILRQFSKVELKPGETGLLTFKIIPEQHFSYPDKTGKIILQRGNYKLFCENHSVNLYFP